MDNPDLTSNYWNSTQVLAWREKTNSQIAWASLVLTIIAAILICIFVLIHFFF